MVDRCRRRARSGGQAARRPQRGHSWFRKAVYIESGCWPAHYYSRRALPGGTRRTRPRRAYRAALHALSEVRPAGTGLRLISTRSARPRCALSVRASSRKDEVGAAMALDMRKFLEKVRRRGAGSRSRGLSDDLAAPGTTPPTAGRSTRFSVRPTPSRGLVQDAETRLDRRRPMRSKTFSTRCAPGDSCF